MLAGRSCGWVHAISTDGATGLPRNHLAAGCNNQPYTDAAKLRKFHRLSFLVSSSKNSRQTSGPSVENVASGISFFFGLHKSSTLQGLVTALFFADSAHKSRKF